LWLVGVAVEGGEGDGLVVEEGQIGAEDFHEGEAPVLLAGGADGNGVERAGGVGVDLGEGAEALGGSGTEETAGHGGEALRLKHEILNEEKRGKAKS